LLKSDDVAGPRLAEEFRQGARYLVMRWKQNLEDG
jgi:hypothetical protein